MPCRKAVLRLRVGFLLWAQDYSGVPFGEQIIRFPLAMQEEWPDLHRYMRFHRQFITLTRQHAQWVDEDDHIIDVYEKHCYLGVEG